MNDCSEMKSISDTKSRSMDFSSDLWSPSSSSLETRNRILETLEINLQQKQIKNPIATTAVATANKNSRNKTQNSFSFSEQEEEDHQEFHINYNDDNNGEKFGGYVKLARNGTVSASSVASHALQSAVKRAFSMRRSSSVSERYCRIHDQSVTLASPIEDEYLAVKKKKSSKSKIIKTCKKLFGI